MGLASHLERANTLGQTKVLDQNHTRLLTADVIARTVTSLTLREARGAVTLQAVDGAEDGERMQRHGAGVVDDVAVLLLDARAVDDDVLR